MFKLAIKTGGAAFRDESRTDRKGEAILDESGREVRRILAEVSWKLKSGYDSGNIMDANGNNVGSWKYE